jgi:small subunit ribosomal protein S18
MARNSKTRTKKKPASRPAPTESKGRARRGRRKVCQFCAARADWVDYKDINTLRRYMNDRGRIRARGATGTCSQHQRDVAIAIKTARELALLPYSLRTSATGPGERRGGARHDRSSPQRHLSRPRKRRPPSSTPCRARPAPGRRWIQSRPCPRRLTH